MDLVASEGAVWAAGLRWIPRNGYRSAAVVVGQWGQRPVVGPW